MQLEYLLIIFAVIPPLALWKLRKKKKSEAEPEAPDDDYFHILTTKGGMNISNYSIKAKKSD